MGHPRVLRTPEMIEAFKKDWEEHGLTLAEMAALYGYQNINGVTRAVQRLGLKPRPGGPSRTALDGGRWVTGPGGIKKWVKDVDSTTERR